MTPNFTVTYRNPGHWDMYTKNEGRIFRIRGGPGKYLAMNEMGKSSTVTEFKTLSACMTYICDQLMSELIVAEGQEPKKIESWNV